MHTITTKTYALRAPSLARLSARLSIALALAGVISSCDVHGLSAPGALASIVVTPNATLSIKSTQQMAAVGYDAAGQLVAVSPTWTVVANGGTISGAGIFSAGTVPGVFPNTVVASVGSIAGATSITVTPGILASITLTPTPVTLAVSGTQQFVAVGHDSAGNTVPFTPTWSIVAGGGTIAPNGIFTAGVVAATFANTVQASNNGITAFATVAVGIGPLASVTVTPNPASLALGTSQQFVAAGKDASGNIVPIVAVWSVVTGGGTITAGGLFTAGAALGTFTNTVKATSGSFSGTATVVVTAGPLATITVTPNPDTLGIGAKQQFVAVGKDAAGNPVLIVPAWTVVANGGTITTGGLFTAGAVAGTFTSTVQASSGAQSGFATVVVTVGSLATITVTPNPAAMLTNASQQFFAAGKDANGNAVAINPFWSVVNGGGAINSDAGLFTAGATAGTFTNTVQASSGAISGSATVTVTAAAASLVNFGAAAPNGIMAGTAVTCVIGGIIYADVSISPGNTVTGYPPCVITGTQHLNDGTAMAGQLALIGVYNTLAGLPCPPANAIVADLGGTTKPAGVYCTASGIGVTGTLTLDGGGNPNANFVFQAGTSLTTAGSIVLINGAQAKNVYWQVGSSATIGTGSQWQGNIVALTSITLVDNATLLGPALARNGAVTLGTNNIIILP